jgi:hypothetical protein
MYYALYYKTEENQSYSLSQIFTNPGRAANVRDFVLKRDRRNIPELQAIIRKADNSNAFLPSLPHNAVSDYEFRKES